MRLIAHEPTHTRQQSDAQAVPSLPAAATPVAPVYRRLTGHEGWQKGGLIMTVWRDDVGYYYHGREGKLYLPRRP